MPREGTAEYSFVTALLVARDGHLPWLRATVDAFLDQSRPADRLVVVDGTSSADLRERLPREIPELEGLDVTFVKGSHDEAFAALADRGVQALPARGSDHVIALRDRRRARPRPTHPADRYHWLWLLHEDSAPTPDSLKALLRSVGRSERIGIAGCKVVELDRPNRLVNIGIDVTPSGRHVARTSRGELDQGQHDGRRDILAVSSAGMLVRQDVYHDLGGFDPAFDGDGDGLDLCWRAHLAGHAVVVVPGATAHQDLDSAHLLRVMEARGERLTRRARRAQVRRSGDPDRPAAHSASTLRRHRQVALARTSWWRFPFSLLWTTISSALLGVLLLLLKRPRAAASEFGQASAVLGIGRILGARRRFRGRAIVRHAQLSSLFVTPAQGRAASWDAVVEALVPGSDRPVHHRLSAESGPMDEDAEEMSARRGVVRRVASHAGLWALASLTLMSVLMLRDQLSAGALEPGHGLAGGELNRYFTSPAAMWHAWRDAWQGPGFGHEAASAPYLPFLAAGTWLVGLVPGVATWSASASALTWLLLLAAPLAGWSAYLTGRSVTPMPWPRAVVALLWGSLAPLTTAVAGGRLGPLVTHIVLPPALAGVFSLARGAGGVTRTAATALALTVVGAFTPVLLPVFAILLLAVLLLGDRPAMYRAGAVLVLVPLLLGHWTLEVLTHPGKLVSGPGTLSGEPSTPALDAALFHPGGAGATPIFLGVPVLLAGLWGAFSGRRLGVERWCLVVLALVGLAATFLAPRHSWGAPEGLHVWVGIPQQLAALSLLGLGLLAAEDTHRRAVAADRRATGRSNRIMVAAATIAAVAVVALTAWSAPAARLRVVTEPMPALVAHDATTSRASMMLDLAERSGAMTYTVRSREAGLPAADPTAPPMRTPQAVDEAVAALVDPASAGRDSAARTLHDAGIAFVSLDRGTSASASVSESLATADGLIPMARTGQMALYRVTGGVRQPAARVLVRGTSGASVVPVFGDHVRVRTHVDPGEPDRLVVVAVGEGFMEHAHVSLDGQPLETGPAMNGLPTYRLGGAGGELVISPGVAWPVWRTVHLVLLGLVVFLAVPFGSARSRRNA